MSYTGSGPLPSPAFSWSVVNSSQYSIIMLEYLLHMTASPSMHLSEVGKQTFLCKSPHIANPQILGLILPSQSANSKQSWKSSYKKMFFYVQIQDHCMLYLQREKVCICGLAEVLSLQITKKIGSANLRSAQCLIFGRSAKLTNCLRFAEVFCRLPTFGFHWL